MGSKTKIKMIRESFEVPITASQKQNPKKKWEAGEVGYIESIIPDGSVNGFSIIVILGNRIEKCFSYDIEIIN
jgi:hypothetical protein